MFIMDMPAVPAQDTPIVLVQAATPAAGATPQPDYVVNMCKETESTGDPSSAMRTVDPAGMLAVFIEKHSQRLIDAATEATIKTTLLQGTTHGKISSVIDNTGRPWYAYDAEPNYIGNDRAIFLAEFEGKVYKIVLELHVFTWVNEKIPSSCPPPQLIKVTKPIKPSSGASGFGSGYDLSSVSVIFVNRSIQSILPMSEIRV